MRLAGVAGAAVIQRGAEACSGRSARGQGERDPIGHDGSPPIFIEWLLRVPGRGR